MDTKGIERELSDLSYDLVKTLSKVRSALEEIRDELSRINQNLGQQINMDLPDEV